ncbi:hypothetical protein CXQ80_02795 [Pseudomonas sp. 02C 26]|uniref:hypothetical protein n=1 Tax=unclassified Pseudomonas TaxID=196821 RepID=UPI000C6D7687|nr:hypothetical protein [Pseudomonas sp. 02C 26]AUF94822.1 hypothetical protein CXQ80_02795 [Pseudomonas sp. 02C 26]
MDTLKSLALTIISSAGVSAALLAALAWLARSWIGERLKASIRHEYDDRLEKLRADLKAQGDAQLTSLKSELDRQAEKLRIASASFSEVQKATIAKKIEAVDALWLGVIRSRAAFPGEVTITDIFTDKEMQGFYTNPQMRKYSNKLAGISEYDYFQAGFEEVQLFRPHLGEYTWALYVTYRSVLGRSIYLIKQGAENPEKLAWHQDDNIKRLIASAFGPELMNEFNLLTHSRYQWLSYKFDTLLFKAIDTLLTGKSFSDAALRQAQEMEQQIGASLPPN